MLTALVDYESGNLHSAQKAFERMAREGNHGDVVVTSDPATVARADRVVLPGDGAFPSCRAALIRHQGLFEAIERGDPRRASELMTGHLEHSRDRLFGGGLIDLRLSRQPPAA